ncbi:MAG TPA: putative lipid II flippase FtsW [Actinobacteria bacterium]|nr:putative lipid II flippase FtsW [Actinomycetota bacterium]
MAYRRVNLRLAWIFLGVTSILLFIGAVMVLNASSVMAFSEHGDSYYYFKRQLLFILIGLAAMIFFAGIDYRFLRKFSLVGIGLSIIVLIMVFIPGLGHTAGGASRWISMGDFSFQPSELAKFVVVLYVADILSKKRGKITKFSDLLIPLALVVGPILALILFQPHLGAVLIICSAVFFLIFLYGARLIHLLGLGITGLILIFIFIYIEPYRLRRFTAFLNPWKDPRKTGFHIIQSLLAFGSGGLAGIGLGMSRQKFLYLPEAHTDFILAIIGEEFGLAGTLLVVFLFMTLIVVGMIISLKSKDNFGKLLGCGMICLIATQALVNMGGVTGVLPTTGVPLPFLSYGGSSLLFNLCSVGVLLSIANSRKTKSTRRGE